ncbi:DUF2892 domain-containing protein [Aquimarina sp. 2201CG5-10]|uniref:YgaP family membrane protein n=1 Tax=Aquimarina callyspongiae TaxID=3098150 RepID=UPI002AB41AD8|nr:DUF2892 domain-containing protein [Aquimarina sp. 2201CG5-10]MDY8134916.1 DUF2892 domain-containing protein [Aquimarina sp. 2201CG5-10]
MKKNLGKVDSIIRILIGVVLAYLFYNNIIADTLGVVLLSASGVLIITGFMGWCPLYRLLGIRTCRVKNGLKEDN